MSRLQEMKTAILADGIVDANEVRELRALLLEDGVIDREEADVLFEINDAVTGKENSPAWDLFFANALTAHVLHDEVSPNVIDEDEATYLIGKIQGDGQVDFAEKALLANIKVHAESIHPTLEEVFTQYGI